MSQNKHGNEIDPIGQQSPGVRSKVSAQWRSAQQPAQLRVNLPRLQVATDDFAFFVNEQHGRQG
jgi:hypothetical protein